MIFKRRFKLLICFQSDSFNMWFKIIESSLSFECNKALSFLENLIIRIEATVYLEMWDISLEFLGTWFFILFICRWRWKENSKRESSKSLCCIIFLFCQSHIWCFCLIPAMARKDIFLLFVSYSLKPPCSCSWHVMHLSHFLGCLWKHWGLRVTKARILENVDIIKKWNIF